MRGLQAALRVSRGWLRRTSVLGQEHEREVKRWWRKSVAVGPILRADWINLWEAYWADEDVMEQRRSGHGCTTVVDAFTDKKLSTGLHFHYCPRRLCLLTLCCLGDLWAHAWGDTAPACPQHCQSEEAESPRAPCWMFRAPESCYWLDLLES